MYSVTQRIKAISQPRGGYIPPKSLNVCMYSDENTTCDTIEFTPSMSSLAGLVVDYMTRWKMGASKEDAFEVSLLGAQIAMQEAYAKSLLEKIKSLNHKSLSAACQLVGYDVCYRAGMTYFKPIHEINPTKQETNMMKRCIERSIAFFATQKPITKNGFTCDGGYTGLIRTGDGDYLTEDTLWDFKTSKRPPTKEHTLQLLIYYLMGIHSIHPEFQTIDTLGIYNPILNTAYTIKVSEISNEVMQAVSRDVIGYTTPQEPSLWRESLVPNISEKREQAIGALQTLSGTKCNLTELPNGIHDISVDDYWGFYSQYATGMRPKFSNIAYIKFIKADLYKMFIAVSPDNKLYILNGGIKTTCKHDLEYYFQNLTKYGNAANAPLKNYFETLYAISAELNSIYPDDKYITSELKRCIQDEIAQERMHNADNTIQAQMRAYHDGLNDAEAYAQFCNNYPERVSEIRQEIAQAPIFNACVDGYKIILNNNLTIIMNPCDGNLEAQYKLDNPFTHETFEESWYDTIYEAIKRHDRTHSRLLRQYIKSHKHSLLAQNKFPHATLNTSNADPYEILPHYLDEPASLMRIMKSKQRLYDGLITKWEE